jgi:hypothetical protein
MAISPLFAGVGIAAIAIAADATQNVASVLPIRLIMFDSPQFPLTYPLAAGSSSETLDTALAPAPDPGVRSRVSPLWTSGGLKCDRVPSAAST